MNLKERQDTYRRLYNEAKAEAFARARKNPGYGVDANAVALSGAQMRAVKAVATRRFNALGL